METVYTDGSALKNSKTAPAGWAVYFKNEDVLRSGHLKAASNNVAELFAIGYVCWYILNNELPYKQYTIKSDSEYAIKAVTGINKAKANVKLITGIQKSLSVIRSKGIEMSFEHVMAHTGGSDEDSKWNDLVDKTARKRAGET